MRFTCLDRHETCKVLKINKHVINYIFSSGHLNIWNYETQSLVKTIEATTNDLPIRTAKFVERKSWVVCGRCNSVHFIRSGIILISFVIRRQVFKLLHVTYYTIYMYCFVYWVFPKIASCANKKRQLYIALASVVNGYVFLKRTLL